MLSWMLDALIPIVILGLFGIGSIGGGMAQMARASFFALLIFYVFAAAGLFAEGRRLAHRAP